MNCKPGDIAIFVRNDWPENIGGLVRVRRPCLTWRGDWECEALSQLRTERGSVLPGSLGIAIDSDLRPLRDSDGTDEMLRIAGLPKRDEVKA